MLRGLGSVGSVGSKGRQAGSTRQSLRRRKALYWARPSRLLPVQARAGTGASGADANFLFGNLFVGRPVLAALH